MAARAVRHTSVQAAQQHGGKDTGKPQVPDGRP
jgi:hypothetical protein